MDAVLSEENIFACARTLILEDGELSLQVSAAGIKVRFPTTRRIAEHMDVPHYYVLPYFAGLETQGFLTRTERVGIFTTPAGTRRLFSGMSDDELARVKSVCGNDLFRLILAAGK
ncbi:hypothetical protein J6A32_02535 [Methanocorpusculum sp.]|nr:hypothetical protein [Methanocorpusculum sp.]